MALQIMEPCCTLTCELWCLYLSVCLLYISSKSSPAFFGTDGLLGSSLPPGTTVGWEFIDTRGLLHSLGSNLEEGRQPDTVNVFEVTDPELELELKRRLSECHSASFSATSAPCFDKRFCLDLQCLSI
mmetsp:Transcript_34902/g.54562  ORF Transcript_34902/g.54562 Transcript_34902/m.54562 type:complete len:128 (+) Transcript_34902:188-571(+)